jgi:hypothetical protein
VVVYQRTFEDDQVYVAINFGAAPAEVGELSDCREILLSIGAPAQINQGSVTLPQRSGHLLI